MGLNCWYYHFNKLHNFVQICIITYGTDNPILKLMSQLLHEAS